MDGWLGGKTPDPPIFHTQKTFKFPPAEGWSYPELPIIMGSVKHGCISNRIVTFQIHPCFIIFHFQDYGRKSIWKILLMDKILHHRCLGFLPSTVSSTKLLPFQRWWPLIHENLFGQFLNILFVSFVFDSLQSMMSNYWGKLSKCLLHIILDSKLQRYYLYHFLENVRAKTPRILPSTAGFNMKKRYVPLNRSDPNVSCFALTCSDVLRPTKTLGWFFRWVSWQLFRCCLQET